MVILSTYMQSLEGNFWINLSNFSDGNYIKIRCMYIIVCISAITEQIAKGGGNLERDFSSTCASEM